MKYIELVKGLFDTTHFDKAKPKNAPYVAYSALEKKLLFTTFIKVLINTAKKVAYNAAEYTPEYVDLGLPSGIKWATCNIGAKTPEENGMYFSWGDIEGFKFVGQEKWGIEEVAKLYLIILEGIEPENITPDAIWSVIDILGDNPLQAVDALLSKYGIDGIVKDPIYWDNYKFSADSTGVNFTKYSPEDGLDTLTAEDDAAVQLLGNGWRMPTKIDWKELCDNTIRTWIDTSDNTWTDNDVNDGKISEGLLNGILFTSTNGNSIFLPTSGGRFDELYNGDHTRSSYWSSSFKSDSAGDPFYASSLHFEYDGWFETSIAAFRYEGLPIRPVFSGN